MFNYFCNEKNVVGAIKEKIGASALKMEKIGNFKAKRVYMEESMYNAPQVQKSGAEEDTFSV